ncbi:MAG: division/cell wall cluster transcriptional repressor MraZ [Anaerolineae bacterium]|nr:division/cell wall cluster transcriptional repressor MraZ [Anaerolineae bacterium]
MFLGQYFYTLDTKGRLIIPSRYRDHLQGEFVITRGLDRCLTLYPNNVWEEIAAKVTALPITDPRGRALRRIFFSDANKVELDRQGRILIPDRLREIAGITTGNEVAIVGLDRFIELWNPDQWRQQNENRPEYVAEDPQIWGGLNI